jgi:hypothetical protein
MLDTPSPRTDTPLDAAGRRAAVGGLLPLPLHPGRDQERDADPVRDHLPAVYAAECAGAFDHQRLESLATLEPEHATPELSVELRWLEQTGRGSGGRPAPRADAWRIDRVRSRSVAGRRLSFDRGRLTVRSEPAEDGEHYLRDASASTTRRRSAAGLTAPAPCASRCSQPTRAAVAGGKFVSPLEPALRQRQHLPGPRQRRRRRDRRRRDRAA